MDRVHFKALLSAQSPGRGRAIGRIVLLWIVLVALLLPQRDTLAAPISQAVCINLIENGGFETSGPQWLIQPGPRPPLYSTENTFNGSLQSMRLGNGFELPNVESTSEVQYIPLQLPREAEQLILRFRYLPRFDAPPGNDLQQVDIYYQATNQLALSVLNTQVNEADWKLVEVDLTAFKGQAISLRFRVRNDGQAGRTTMFIDDVSLEYCSLTPIPPTGISTVTTPTFPALSPTPSATWGTPIPTLATPIPPWPTQTLMPPGCPNGLPNGDFESDGGWLPGESAVPPRLVSEPVHTGSRSMLLGIPATASGDVQTYSSIRQLVTLPLGSVQLRWWQWLGTQEAPSTAPSSIADRLDLVLLTPDLNVIAVPSRTRSNDGSWQERAVDLSAFAGQSVYIYFNVFNDGNGARTWAYLDDIALYNCAQAMPFAAEAVEPLPAFTPALNVLPPGQTTAQAPDVQIQPVMSPVALTDTLPISVAADILTATVAASVAPVQATATPVGAIVAIVTSTGNNTSSNTTSAPQSVNQPAISIDFASGSGTTSWWGRLRDVALIACSIPILIAIILFFFLQIRRLWRSPAPRT